MKSRILFVLFVCGLCTCENAFAQGLTDQQLQDAIKRGIEQGVKNAQDSGAISKDEADKFLKAAQESQAESEKRYKELQAKKASAPIEWKEFNSTEGGFTVLFPGTPIVSHLAEESGMIHHKFSHAPLDEGIVVGVEYYELPKNADKRKLAGLLDQFRNQFLQTGALRSEKSLTLDGNPGKQLILDFAKIQATSEIRLYQTKDRLYQLMCVVQPEGAEIPESAKKFFDSFALIGSASGQGKLGSSPPAKVAATEHAQEKLSEIPSVKAKAGSPPVDPAAGLSSGSDRAKAALRNLRAAHEIDEKEITSEMISGVEQALESWKGDKLEELIGELEALKENTTRNRKTFKRFWDAETKSSPSGQYKPQERAAVNSKSKSVPLVPETAAAASVPSKGTQSYETEIGPLKAEIIPDGFSFTMGSNGKLTGGGFVFVNAGCASILDTSYFKVFKATNASSPLLVTLIQDKVTRKWLATDGRYYSWNDENGFIEGQTIRVIGGADNPVTIVGKSFVNTSVRIVRGEPVNVSPSNN